MRPCNNYASNTTKTVKEERKQKRNVKKQIHEKKKIKELNIEGNIKMMFSAQELEQPFQKNLKYF